METFEQFVAAINSHDPEALGRLMAADHVFVDGLGNRVQGSLAMKAGWTNYFALCPDYWLRVDTCLEGNGTVLAAGEAGGTIDRQTWKIPAAWKAMIRDGKVTEWRVFADNKPVFDILGERKGSS
jgi:ketosteroid isomerase-like protein